MPKLPLIEGVLSYVKENNVSFCTPGHKAGQGFLKTDEGKQMYESFIKGDITEVDGVDNLHHPEGIIKESLKLLSDLYGSKKSYFLVNGSTSGNLIMLFSCFNEGDEIIVERNCHRSIFNGIIMRKLRPIYIENKINKEFNAPLSVNMEHFLCLIEENKYAKGIVLTYPNYYGVCTDLKIIIDKAKCYGMRVLIDSAHGAHLGFNEKLPIGAMGLGADMVVMSAHKTLPSLTQTAFLHVSDSMDLEKVDFYFSSFTSTSPSYMLMCSLDYARYYLEREGKKEYEKLIELCTLYREKINAIEGFHVLDSDNINKSEVFKVKLDPTRFVVNIKKGFSGIKVFQLLKNNGITAELCDASNVVLIFSPFNEEREFQKLYEVLKNCDIEEMRAPYVEVAASEIPKLKCFPYEAMEKKKQRIHFLKSVGKVSAGNIVPYPPGVPVLMMGEIISLNTVNMIEYYLQNGITILGVYDNEYIDIVEE